MTLVMADRILLGVNPKEYYKRWYIEEPNTGCWLWIGYVDKDGYGGVTYQKRFRGAHQLIYELHNGVVPIGFQLDHLCKVKICVNPEHMELVSSKTNTQRRSSNKLNQELADRIRTLRRSGSSLYELAMEFDVSQATISNIMNGKVWL